MPKANLKALDIGCDHCSMRIKKALTSVAVKDVQVDVATQQVTFEYPDEQVLAKAKAAMAAIGYPAS